MVTHESPQSCIHGGGPRQMLLGWHYRWEYANDYGANQYCLTSRGFVVLSVDYRLSVGYGQAFQFADNTSARWRNEYRDILAADVICKPARTSIRVASVWGARRRLSHRAGARAESDVCRGRRHSRRVHDRLPSARPSRRAIAGDGIVRRTEAGAQSRIRIVANRGRAHVEVSGLAHSRR